MQDKLLKFTKQNILLYVVFIASICSLIGCAVAVPVGISMGIGSVYLSKERAPIQVTEDQNYVKGCTFIKQVKASSLWGGMLFQDKALEKTISDLTQESVEAGANVLLIRVKSKTFTGSRSEGDAYRCQIDSNATDSPEKQIEAKTQEKKTKAIYRESTPVLN